MDFSINQLTHVLPEIILLFAAIAALFLDLFCTDKQKPWAYYTIQAGFLLALLCLVLQTKVAATLAFNGLIIDDAVGRLLRLSILGVAFFALLYSRDYVQSRIAARAEYYILATLSTIGMMVLCASHNLLTIYLGLELLSLPLYAMVAMQREVADRSEAAMKYFVMGALASGMLLYGMSMFYGATGSLDITAIADAVANTEKTPQTILLFGLVFLIVGIGFKFAAAPFHMWAPDVYTGAPTSVTLFLGSVPKLAAMGMTLRLLVFMLPALQSHWQVVFTVMAILSMLLGNLLAIAQTNFKRMLAYSSIAHIGYMLLGLLAGTPEGYAAALFYIVVYAMTSLAAFGMLLLLSREGFDAENLADFRGLNQRSPWYAFMMLLVMFSMAGVPPLVGFLAKLFVLKALFAVNMVWLAVLALAFAIIGVFYYIRIVRLMYFDDAIETTPINCARDMQIAVSINAVMLLLLGIFPTVLFNACIHAFN